MVSKEQTLEALREFPATQLARWRLSTGHGVTVWEKGQQTSLQGLHGCFITSTTYMEAWGRTCLQLL